MLNFEPSIKLYLILYAIHSWDSLCVQHRSFCQLLHIPMAVSNDPCDIYSHVCLHAWHTDLLFIKGKSSESSKVFEIFQKEELWRCFWGDRRDWGFVARFDDPQFELFWRVQRKGEPNWWERLKQNLRKLSTVFLCSYDDCPRTDFPSELLGYRCCVVLQRDYFNQSGKLARLFNSHDTYRRHDARFVLRFFSFRRQLGEKRLAADFCCWDGNFLVDDGDLFLPGLPRHVKWSWLASHHVFSQLHSVLLRWVWTAALHYAGRNVRTWNQIHGKFLCSVSMLDCRLHRDQDVSSPRKCRRQLRQLLDFLRVLRNCVCLHVQSGFRDERFNSERDSGAT